ncbi:MAG: saccharopine dehydrogenase NADP-binding domain-containing protein [Acidimicrobiaceae bacterium]|nr:saccharopine dehydrogenase NADP-binding domain-containing protein [Acidimicrobiaceae bacterium]
MTHTRILVLGAGGDMMSVAVQELAAHDPDLSLVCGDVDSRRLDRLMTALPPRSQAESLHLDLFDKPRLAEAVAEADLVVNGAGPFYRTAIAVIDSCLAAGVDYLDIGDDIEAAKAAIARDNDARHAGVSLLIGCGVSPGLTNLLAAELLALLDNPQVIDVAWCVGDEGEQVLGHAVLEHALHMVSGQCLTWSSGSEATTIAWDHGEVFDFGPPLGHYQAFEVAHPEVVTLPRQSPGLREVRCFGALHPPPVNGLLRGIGRAVDLHKLDPEEAITFLGDILAGKNGSLTGWRHALAGIREARRRGDTSRGDNRRFLVDALRGRHQPFVGGIACHVRGQRDNQAIQLARRSARSGAGTALSSMAHITGNATAAFIRHAIDHRPPPGCHAPEGWADPSLFHKAMAAHGIPRDYLSPIEERPASPR